jgi:glycosyltransferase involved in cell wall biosynthesis
MSCRIFMQFGSTGDGGFISVAVRVSVAIPTHNRPTFVREALLSVMDQVSRASYEILVLDNGSNPNLCKDVTNIAYHSSVVVRYIAVPEVGLHHCRHVGARLAEGEILAYLDDDIIAPPSWLEAMLKPFSDANVACVGGRIVPRWEAEPPDWLSQFGGNGGPNLSLLDLGTKTRQLSWPLTVYGCNMSVRRSVLCEVGGFHPDAFADRRMIWLRGDGETGLQRKIYQAGYAVVYEPRAWLYHRVPPMRLKPSYFYWRRFIQGISDSYTHTRMNRPSEAVLVRHAGRCLLSAIRSYMLSMLHTNERLGLRADAWYWYGRGQHQVRLAFSDRLRQHVLRETYL